MHALDEEGTTGSRTGTTGQRLPAHVPYRVPWRRRCDTFGVSVWVPYRVPMACCALRAACCDAHVDNAATQDPAGRARTPDPEPERTGESSSAPRTTVSRIVRAYVR